MYRRVHRGQCRARRLRVDRCQRLLRYDEVQPDQCRDQPHRRAGGDRAVSRANAAGGDVRAFHRRGRSGRGRDGEDAVRRSGAARAVEWSLASSEGRPHSAGGGMIHPVEHQL